MTESMLSVVTRLAEQLRLLRDAVGSPPRWATVEALTPTRVRRDGWNEPLVEVGDSLGGPLDVGDRVLTEQHGRRVTILGGPGVGSMTGEVRMWAAAAIPPGWLPCWGQALSRTTYARLFGVVGTIYGAGDGTTTFNLPSFVGRVPVGPSAGYSPMNGLGLSGGSYTHTLTAAQMPAHQHSLNESGGGNVGYSEAGGTTKYTVGYGAARNNTGVMTANAGGGESHPIVQPFTTINFIIRT